MCVIAEWFLNIVGLEIDVMVFNKNKIKNKKIKKIMVSYGVLELQISF